ncbi:GAP1-N2 domain-containing protein, partial [Nocardioides malaquae]|uniref:GAP1-N2 domain-containing protein n=1 Tax=Nocardioides malaquae TaxID=2773426 RepID=UPI001D0CEE7E
MNPVSVAYWKIKAIGKTFPVLSRVADYGLDYSQRSNKLGHHLVLHPSEFAVAGPAAVANEGSIFLTEWDGTLQQKKTPREIPRLPSR